MSGFSRANSDKVCERCEKEIKKGSYYINQLYYKGGSSKTCIECIRIEMDNIISNQEEKELRVKEIEI